MAKKPGRTEAQKAARREKAAAKKQQTVTVEEMPDGGKVTTIHAGGGIMVDIVEPIKPTPQIETPTPTKPIGVDFVILGYSVALADLADAKGKRVSDIINDHDLLTDAGISTTLAPSVVKRAEQLLRDLRDGQALRQRNRDFTAISNLEPGSYFSLDGRFGRFVEMVGGDAKVVVGDKTIMWSNGTVVKREVFNESSVVFTDNADGSKTTATKQATKKVTRVGPPKTARTGIFGHPTTRVMMWMGKNGYDAAAVTKVLAHFGCSSTPTSIGTFIRSGVKGDRGDVAPLTTEQAAQVKQIVNS